MKTRSSLQRRMNSETSDRLVATIQPRPWADPLYDQPQPARHDFSHVDLFSHAPQRSAIQPKLTIGQPNDVYEQEADRVAEQVMSMPAATQQPVQRQQMPEEDELQAKPLATTITPLVQREMAPEEEEPEPVQAKLIQREAIPEEEEPEPVQAKLVQREAIPEEEEEPEPVQAKLIQREAIPEEEEPLQAKSLDHATIQREAMPEEEEPLQMKSSLQRATDGNSQSTNTLEDQLNQSSGSPLPSDVRAFMEPRFGADFSQVRVHTGSNAVQMNRDLNAQAFTHKQDIYFGAGKAPGKDALTAHELTHVVQQTGNIQTSGKPAIQRKSHSASLSGGGYFDDSNFSLKTQAVVSPEALETPVTVNLSEGLTLPIKGETLQAGGSTKGTISFLTRYNVLRDDSFVSGGDKEKKGDFTSTFDYSVGHDNSILLHQDPAKAPTTELRDIFTIEDQDDNSYRAYVMKSLQGSGPENIHQRVALLFNEKKVEETSKTTKTSSTNINAGVDANFSTGMSTKLTLQLDVNGNDILMLLGGAKLLKGGLSMLKRSKLLEKIIGNLGESLIEILKKQTLTYNLTHEMAAGLSAEFGLDYKYRKDTEETQRVTSAFTTGGVQAEEVHQIQILQNRSIGTGFFFEKEDQGELSLKAKEAIDSFITPYVPEITRVGSRLKVSLLEGRGSKTGKKDYNQTLGEIRAQKVKEHLMIRHGLQEENFVQITSKGNTKANQVFVDASDRRVNIKLVEK